MKIEQLVPPATITQPGAYFCRPDYYHADPCPDASLSQSLAKIIIQKSPWHAWTAHPRLNPDFVPDDRTTFDLGTAAHTLMLGDGRRISVQSFKDWRTDTAKHVRDMIRDRGDVAVLAHQYEQMGVMVEAGRLQLQDFGLNRAFAYIDGKPVGYPELCLAWQEGTIWCRTLIDWHSLPATVPEVFDYKTKNESVSPRAIGRVIHNDGWDIQAAFQERGLDVLDPENAGRRDFYFIAQETDPPYALVPYKMSEAHMTMGRKKVEYAIARYQAAMKTGYWPSYCEGVIEPRLEPWSEKEWLERELTEEPLDLDEAARNMRAG